MGGGKVAIQGATFGQDLHTIQADDEDGGHEHGHAAIEQAYSGLGTTRAAGYGGRILTKTPKVGKYRY